MEYGDTLGGRMSAMAPYTRASRQGRCLLARPDMLAAVGHKGDSTVTRKADAKRMPSTRDRILHVAVNRFASGTYDEVSLRDIACDVGVDVAYVHRSFGSKANLFEAALKAASGGKSISPLENSPPGETLAESVGRLLDKPRQEQGNGIGPMDILIRSLASKNATKVLRNKVQREFTRPLAERVDHEGELRAAMIMAVLMGVGMARDVLQLDPLMSPDRQDRVRQLLSAVISTLIETDLDPAS